MKRIKETLKSIVLSVICFAMVLSILSPAATVKADLLFPTEIAYKRNLTLSSNTEYVIRLSDKDLGGRTVTDVKADKKGMEDYLYPFTKGFGCDYFPEGIGKMTVTMTLSGSGKKTVKKKCTINFIKYVNPLEKTSFLNSYVMEDYKEMNHTGCGADKDSKETVRYKAKKGWEIVSIRFEYYPDSEYYDPENEKKSVKVKNNSSFRYPEGDYNGGIFVVKVKHKKTGFIETMCLDVYFSYGDETNEN